ncbi:hypothetical protein D3C80_1792480 [compost metagenome]|uniref:Uncharacterized protein n=1 Tax=Pseudomonas fluorescens TaxID=294 RepID=A0A8H2NRE6_PSEFL|nr:hypothetical protein [Pseudomonas fluorescens]VVO86053.1 hypothetical protein PS900_02074 [Pseudomonas fluorescens]
MSETKQCNSCGTKLVNKRSHALTCSNTCRWRVWQAKQSAMVPVKLMFNTVHFELVKNAADQHGVSVNEWIHTKAIG